MWCPSLLPGTGTGTGDAALVQAMIRPEPTVCPYCHYDVTAVESHGTTKEIRGDQAFVTCTVVGLGYVKAFTVTARFVAGDPIERRFEK
jgi:hypothetical protein